MMDKHAEPSGESPVINVSNLEKRYGSGESEVTAVDDVSFSIEKGTVIGLLGPNGAGKTTTIKMILNLVKPSSGEVEIKGADPQNDSESVYRDVAALLEGARNAYWQLTLRDNLHFFSGLNGFEYDKERATEIISEVGLSEKSGEPIRNFSRGMKQKAAFACALIQKPSVLFLDEPTLGLDVEAAQNLRRIIKELAEEDRTVIISSHNMDLIQDICDRAIIMSDGRVIADDEVQNLIHVFNTKRYRFSVSGAFGSEIRNVLAEFQTNDFEETEDGVEFEVLLGADENFYPLIDRLREAGAIVENVDSLDDDLEKAFVRAVDESTKSEPRSVVQ